MKMLAALAVSSVLAVYFVDAQPPQPPSQQELPHSPQQHVGLS